LTRPGRFDRNVHVNAPDQPGREAILKVHTRSVPLAPDADLEQVSRVTPGMTGAELANLVNEAAMLAAQRGLTHVGAAEFSDALEKILLGTERHIVMPEDERRRTAYHEAGHALLGMLAPGADPVRRVSIIPRGRALGVTVSTPEVDRYGYDRNYLIGRITGALGGMAAESIVFDVVTSGAESDLETATSIARQMVGRWGMSEKIGPVTVLPQEGDPRMAGISEGLLSAVDTEVRRLIDEAYANAKRLLEENRDRLESITSELLEHETLDEAEVYAAAGITRTAPTPELWARSPAHRPDEGGSLLPVPPLAALSQFPRSGVAVVEEPRPDPPGRLSVERVAGKEREGGRIGLEEALEQAFEPQELHRGSEHEEPHPPIQAQVVGRDLARPAPGRTGFAGELVFLPRRALGIGLQRALDDHLLPAASDRAEGAVGTHEVPRVGEVHPLAAAEQIEGG